MKKTIITVLAVLSILQCSACGKKTAFTVGTDVGIKDITDFYYTRENINYNASYQRYRFYAEDGEYFFYHETRERPNDYGPATEDDITSVGTIMISDEEWEEVFSYLEGGTVSRRGETESAGASGPWMYIYWDEDRAVYQEYSFASVQMRSYFEEYCTDLSLKAG